MSPPKTTRRRAGTLASGNDRGTTTTKVTKQAPDPASPRPLLELREVAQVLQFGERQTYRLAANGQLPGLRRLGRRWFIVRRELDAWLGLNGKESQP